MKYSKQVSLGENWLEHVDGKTVKEAIAYLSTLHPDSILNVWATAADDTGLEYGGDLCIVVPLTKDEELHERTVHMRHRIKEYEKARLNKHCQTPAKQASYDKLIVELREKIAKIEDEYKN